MYTDAFVVKILNNNFRRLGLKFILHANLQTFKRRRGMINKMQVNLDKIFGESRCNVGLSKTKALIYKIKTAGRNKEYYMNLFTATI